MPYTSDGRGDVLDIAVCQNYRQSDPIVTDILGSHHEAIMFSIIDHVRARECLDQLKSLQTWSGFKA
jgi:hypothetical protein